MSSSSSKKMIVLKCSNGEEFEIEEAVALQSQTIKHMIEDDRANNIPVHNVTAPVLSKVLEYLKRHVAKPADKDAAPPTDLKEFDEDFIKVEKPMLFDLVSAANYLDIRSLLNLLCQTIANMIKGKTPEQICEILNIEKDFTPEKEEDIRKQNQWAFEDEK